VAVPAESYVRTKTPFALMLRRVTEIWPTTDSDARLPVLSWTVSKRRLLTQVTVMTPCKDRPLSE
jgi:hypothetical protein